MSFEKIEYAPYDTLTADQVNKIQDAILDNIDKINNITAESIGAAKIVTGSYTGTGTFTNTLTIGFRPKFLMIHPNTGSDYVPSYTLIWCGSERESYGGADRTFTVTDTTFTVAITSANSYVSHMNVSKTQYQYIAIG